LEKLRKNKYLQFYDLEIACIGHDNIREKTAKLLQLMYQQLNMMAQARTVIKDKGMETMYPNTQWTRVWKTCKKSGEQIR
jgi:hypothetical protein